MRKPSFYPNGAPEREAMDEFNRRLVDLLLEGHAARMSVAEWLANALEEAQGLLPGGMEELLENRPGCWEAEHVRALAGQPSYDELVARGVIRFDVQ